MALETCLKLLPQLDQDELVTLITDVSTRLASVALSGTCISISTQVTKKEKKAEREMPMSFVGAANVVLFDHDGSEKLEKILGRCKKWIVEQGGGGKYDDDLEGEDPEDRHIYDSYIILKEDTPYKYLDDLERHLGYGNTCSMSQEAFKWRQNKSKLIEPKKADKISGKTKKTEILTKKEIKKIYTGRVPLETLIVTTAPLSKKIVDMFGKCRVFKEKDHVAISYEDLRDAVDAVNSLTREQSSRVLGSEAPKLNVEFLYIGSAIKANLSAVVPVKRSRTKGSKA